MANQTLLHSHSRSFLFIPPMHANKTYGAKGNKVHCLLRIISAFVNKWVLEKITNACDSNLKCSIRKEKKPSKTALGYATLLIPGLSGNIFVRHLPDSKTFLVSLCSTNMSMF